MNRLAMSIIVISFLLPLFATGTLGRNTLHLLGLYPMTGSKWPGGQAMFPASQLAVVDINSNASILADYELNIIVKDTQCVGSFGNNVMYEELYNEDKTKIAILGGGCSMDTIPTAQSSHLWNLIQVSFSSYSPELSDRSRFPLFFRMAPGTTSGNLALIEMIKHFGWSKMATINPADYAAGTNDFRQQAKHHGIDIVVSESFEDDPTLHVANIKKQNARIIYGYFYEDDARKVLCSAYHEGLYGRKYVWILPALNSPFCDLEYERKVNMSLINALLIEGWFDDLWWRADNGAISCAPKEMDIVTSGYLSCEVQALADGIASERISGMDSNTYSSHFDTFVNYTSHSLVGLDHAPYAYDEVWAVAIALDKADRELNQMDPSQSLLNFAYSNNNMSRLFFDKMSQTNFEGISGNVQYTRTGDRLGPMQIRQNQNGTDAAIGTYNPGNRFNKLRWGTNPSIYWQDGRPPADSFTEKDEYQTLSFPLFIAMLIIASLGICMAISFLVFSIIYSDRRIIKLSSPKLNNLIIGGGIFSYASIIFLGLDVNLVTLQQYEVFTKFFTTSLVIGFSACFGALFAKTWRVHRIFAMKSAKPVRIRDSQLILQVFLLAVFEIFIVGLWESVDPRIAQTYPLKTKTDQYNDDIIITVLLVKCTSVWQIYWLGTLFIINGLLLVFGAFLSWETRKIEMTGLNDSKLIGMSIYTVVVMSFTGVPVSIVVNEPNAHYALISLFIFFSTTVTLCLVFIPKIKMRNVVHPGGITTTHNTSTESQVGHLKRTMHRGMNTEPLEITMT